MNVLRNFTLSVAIYRIFATFDVFEKTQDFFRKTHRFFKNPEFLNVLRNFPTSVAFNGKFATFGDFETIQDSFSKTNLFFEKKPQFLQHLQKFYPLNRILRQIYNNLMIKLDIQTREQSMLARLRGLNWQISEENGPFL